ncbi:hypothetical protein GIY11_01535 [Aerococcaceae bacterium DSM 109653]|uniref:Uncharacterized protein n=1 Tax=Fundicoccus ignavus TaxID=2664442 RepID=A0A844BFH9_9LACT|nr:hypothetical protein [Fundicoccus ignavus]MRI80715.1 hypothetical protein [Fundicoccus ignavus]
MTKDNLKPMNYMQKRLFGLIPRGDERLVTLADLANILEIDVRSVQLMVNQLVIKFGIPICSYRDKFRSGLFIAITDEQRLDGLITFKEQVKNMNMRIGSVENADLTITKAYERLHPEVKQKNFQQPYTQLEIPFDCDEIA